MRAKYGGPGPVPKWGICPTAVSPGVGVIPTRLDLANRSGGGFPPSVNAAGQDLAVALDGQPDLATMDAPAGIVEQAVEEVDDDRGREACRVGIDQEKEGPVAKQLFAFA